LSPGIRIELATVIMFQFLGLDLLLERTSGFLPTYDIVGQTYDVHSNKTRKIEHTHISFQLVGTRESRIGFAIIAPARGGKKLVVLNQRGPGKE
jgi:hypothetical protein